MISVIIPIYNTDRGLIFRCLRSVINQRFQQLEILIVDDGSTTLSADDFSQIASLDDRIRILHQPNQGLSSARNAGVRAAVGDYIAFVDGDDEIDPRFFSEAAALASEHRAELVIGAIRYIRENGAEDALREDDDPCLFLGDPLPPRRSLCGLAQSGLPYSILGSACGRLIRRNLCCKYPFREEITSLEDQIFNRELLLNARSVVYLHHVWYRYYQYGASMLHAKKDYRAATLNPEYMAAWNRLNLAEPDPLTRSELCVQSIRDFSALINYRVLSAAEPQKKKLAEYRTLFTQLEMAEIAAQCQRQTIPRRIPFRLAVFLFRHRRYRLHFQLLRLNSSIKAQ